VVGVEVREPDRINPVHGSRQKLHAEFRGGIDEQHPTRPQREKGAMTGPAVSWIRRRADITGAPHHRHPERGSRSKKGQLHGNVSEGDRHIMRALDSKGFHTERVGGTRLMEGEPGRNHDGVTR